MRIVADQEKQNFYHRGHEGTRRKDKETLKESKSSLDFLLTVSICFAYTSHWIDREAASAGGDSEKACTWEAY